MVGDNRGGSAPQPDRDQRLSRQGGLARVGFGLDRLASTLARVWWFTRSLLGASLEVLLALIIVFEEWGWRPLAEAVGRLARWRPWAVIEAHIARLPPYAALLVFALPTLILMPLKFLALFLIANGQLVLASLLFLGAKLVATALIARLFHLTQPALMQIGWFAAVYDTVMPWKDALTERVRASWPWRLQRLWKARLRRLAAASWARLRPGVVALKRHLAAGALLTLRRLRAAGQRLLEDLKRRLAPEP
jgi:hypothetical protein